MLGAEPLLTAKTPNGNRLGTGQLIYPGMPVSPPPPRPAPPWPILWH